MKLYSNKKNKNKTVLIIAVIFTASVVFSSCNEHDDVNVPTPIEESFAESSIQTRSSDLTYGYANSTSNSSNSVPLKGTCSSAIFEGGIIRAQVISQNGSTFKVRITKQDGKVFSTGGTAYIKAASVCGGYGQSYKSYSSGTTSIDIDFTATFGRGILNIYPVTIDNNGYRCYAEPILLYSKPSMMNFDYRKDASLGVVNGVNVKCYNTVNQSIEDGSLLYQCTEFCCRYYQTVYGKNIVNTGTNGGYANTWFNSYSAKGLVRFSNGGTTPPRAGDILCMTGGADGLGHVAIIIEVTNSYVKIAHQNSGTNWYAIGAELTRSGNRITNPTNYTIQGWLRLPTY